MTLRSDLLEYPEDPPDTTLEEWGLGATLLLIELLDGLYWSDPEWWEDDVLWCPEGLLKSLLILLELISSWFFFWPELVVDLIAEAELGLVAEHDEDAGVWSPGGIWNPGGWGMTAGWGTEVDVDDAGNDDD